MKTLVRAIFLTLVAAIAHAEPMSFALRGNGGNCNGCEWIAATGEITADTPQALREYIGDRDRLFAEVMFDSPGGNLGAAIEVGRILREAQARTSVGRSAPMEGLPQWHERRDGGRCASACVFALLGGSTRWAEGGELGVHQFYTPTGSNIPTAATQQIMGQIVLYLIEMGISPELLTLASKIPGDRMHYLTEAELDRLGIATSSSLSPLRLEVGDGGLVARWDALDDDGSLSRAQSLRCSRAQGGWLLSVLHTGIGANNGVPDRARGAPDMHIALGDRTVPLSFAQVVALGPAGPDYAISVHLPVDLHRHAGQNLRFVTNEMRNFFMVLSATGTVPDAATLDVLTRACGD